MSIVAIGYPFYLMSVYFEAWEDFMVEQVYHPVFVKPVRESRDEASTRRVVLSQPLPAHCAMHDPWPPAHIGDLQQPNDGAFEL